MRPDAHKKKASTQYKKKHGLGGDKKAETGGGPSAEKSHGGRGTKDGPPRGAGPMVAAGADDQPRVETTVGQAGVDSAKPSFRRRQVKSNWDRYDGLDDDHEEPGKELRGADFGLLLNVASTSLSQFRFADEQDWDDEPCDPRSFLSVDCVDLADALLCEPLHKRLGLPIETFSADEIDRFTAASERHALNYKRKPRQAVTSIEDCEIEREISDLESVPSEHSDSANDIEQHTVVTPPTHLGEKVVSSGRSTNDGRVKQSKSKEDLPQNPDQPASKAASQTIATDPISTQIPSSVTPTVDPSLETQVSSTSPSSGTACPVDNAESDLDFLLSLDEPAKTEPVDQEEVDPETATTGSDTKEEYSKAETKAKASPVQTSTTNLEDWLDDFLDD